MVHPLAAFFHVRPVVTVLCRFNLLHRLHGLQHTVRRQADAVNAQLHQRNSGHLNVVAWGLPQMLEWRLLRLHPSMAILKILRMPSLARQRLTMALSRSTPSELPGRWNQ
jgi:hypothetical protein